MPTIRSHRPLSVFVSTLVAVVFGVNAWAQDKGAFNADLQRAVQLVRTNKTQEALPILEKLYAAESDNPTVLETLAYALAVSVLPDNKDLEKRKSTLVRARELVEKAQKLGNNSQIVQLLLSQIPADGAVPIPAGPAKSAEAQEELQAGEVAFSKGDAQAAVEHYQRAFKIEPTLYEAPLYIGDAYHVMGKLDLAGENYAKAIALDPDRDTAYRYWGDALLRANQINEAKEKMIEAVIAEPYLRETWQYLTNWAQKARVQLAHPRVDVRRSPIATASEDGSDAWVRYGTVKNEWATDDKTFKNAYPKEQKYRHSLGEEIASLRAVAEDVQGRLNDGKLKEANLDVSVANLLKLHKAGLLEAFVLLAMPDQGISQDYADYRKQNREKLQRYLNEFVTGGK